MSAPFIARALRHGSRRTMRTVSRPAQQKPLHLFPSRPLTAVTTPQPLRYFSTSIRSYAGLMPDTHDPKPPQNEDHHQNTTPTEVSEEEYHEQADQYMERIHEKAEQMQESREDIEVEYSAGVLSVTMPPNGTYVINKQPPNKQIWLASPVSGPKRFDWVVAGESMHQKEGGGVGDWVYIRDGTKLSDVLSKELGISVNVHGEVEADLKPSIDPVE